MPRRMCSEKQTLSVTKAGYAKVAIIIVWFNVANFAVISVIVKVIVWVVQYFYQYKSHDYKCDLLVGTSGLEDLHFKIFVTFFQKTIGYIDSLPCADVSIWPNGCIMFSSWRKIKYALRIYWSNDIIQVLSYIMCLRSILHLWLIWIFTCVSCYTSMLFPSWISRKGGRRWRPDDSGHAGKRVHDRVAGRLLAVDWRADGQAR